MKHKNTQLYPHTTFFCGDFWELVNYKVNEEMGKVWGGDDVVLGRGKFFNFFQKVLLQ